MITEITLLKVMLDRAGYDRCQRFLNRPFIKDNSPEVYRMLLVLDSLHKQQVKTSYTVDEYEALFFDAYPAMKDKEKQMFIPLFSRIRMLSLDEEITEKLIESHKARTLASDIAILAIDVTEGRKSINELADQLAKIEKINENTSLVFVDDDLDSLIEQQINNPGLRWRLQALNKSLGSIRKGNSGFLFSRTEVGKTAFNTSEVSWMAQQAFKNDMGPVLHFNNEESGSDIIKRYYSATLGKTWREILATREESKERYLELTGRCIHVIDSDKGAINKVEIEAICEEMKPSLIVLDSTDKIQGFKADRDDLRLGAAYQWARELAKQYAPVINVCQAGSTGEGKRHLQLNDVDSSHTAKQKESDWILGIGKSFEEGFEYIRYLHLLKNKLPGDEDTLPENRHAKMEVLIKPEWSRYADLERY